MQQIQSAIYRPVTEQGDDVPYIYRRQRSERPAAAEMAKVD
ncbi:MAG: hypothetical protein WAK55_06440 [Xanthobacteraceae bacterium]